MGFRLSRAEIERAPSPRSKSSSSNCLLLPWALLVLTVDLRWCCWSLLLVLGRGPRRCSRSWWWGLAGGGASGARRRRLAGPRRRRRVRRRPVSHGPKRQEWHTAQGTTTGDGEESRRSSLLQGGAKLRWLGSIRDRLELSLSP
jgi:hypothetical protein